MLLGYAGCMVAPIVHVFSSPKPSADSRSHELPGEVALRLPPYLLDLPCRRDKSFLISNLQIARLINYIVFPKSRSALLFESLPAGGGSLNHFIVGATSVLERPLHIELAVLTVNRDLAPNYWTLVKPTADYFTRSLFYPCCECFLLLGCEAKDINFKLRVEVRCGPSAGTDFHLGKVVYDERSLVCLGSALLRFIAIDRRTSFSTFRLNRTSRLFLISGITSVFMTVYDTSAGIVAVDNALDS